MHVAGNKTSVRIVNPETAHHNIFDLSREQEISIDMSDEKKQAVEGESVCAFHGYCRG